MILWLWLFGSVANAIDLNDRLRIELDGGERVEGYFVRAGDDLVVMTRPGRGDVVKVPCAIVSSVEVNGSKLGAEEFVLEIEAAWQKRLNWIKDAPPVPPAGLVGPLNLLLAGSGHAALSRWDLGGSMMVVDAIGMSVVGLELAGKGTQRMDVLISAAAISAMFKSYAFSDGLRRVRRRTERQKLED